MPVRPRADSVAIVTGGSGGVGPVIGLALSRRGIGSVVFAQRGDASSAVAAVVAAGGRAAALPCDVSSRAGVAAFFAAFSALHPRLDVLVNCAGACPRTAIEDVDEAEFAAALAVNTAGALWLCQAARPLMWAGGGGAIVNVGSLAGEDGANAASIACNSIRSTRPDCSVTVPGRRPPNLRCSLRSLAQTASPRRACAA